MDRLIEKAFKNLGVTPRAGQFDTVKKVVSLFNQGTKNVVLNAPTGTGKSIIGAAIAETMYLQEKTDVTSIILSHTNVLSDQYKDTFSKNESFLVMKGASNYPCKVLEDRKHEQPNAENCVFSVLKEDLKHNCNNCEYQQIKSRKNSTSHVITNYAYYFVDSIFLADTPVGFQPRQLVIWDEAHVINEVFCEFISIVIAEKQLQLIEKDLKEYLELSDSPIHRKLKQLTKQLKDGSISTSNYLTYLKDVSELYYEMQGKFSSKAEKNQDKMELFIKYNKISSGYMSKWHNINSFLKEKYEHAFQYDEKTSTVSVKPIFISDKFDKVLNNSSYNLFMSATISDKFISETCNIDCKMVTVEPTFPPESKKVVFWKPRSLSYKTMQDQKTVDSIVKDCSLIVKASTKKGQNGMIQTPSFDVTAMIAEHIRKECTGVQVFEHERGTKQFEILKQFKECKDTKVLLSPSMFEGVSLNDDLSRYQIIVKAPYPSLGDERIKYIMNNYPDIYRILTLKKIVQGIGRSVRHADDWAITYILDSNAMKLFDSDDNIWHEEFQVFEKR